VTNCNNDNGGGLAGAWGGVYLQDTRWINNSATEFGGAVYTTNGGSIYLNMGLNEFINNSAGSGGAALAASGGPIAMLPSVIVYAEENVELSGNSAPGNSPNFALLGGSRLEYPAGSSPPPLASEATAISVVYVDADATCGELCDGSSSNPYPTIAPFGSWPMFLGGTVYLMPGVYSGGNNTNLIFHAGHAIVSQWPNTTGDVVIDCQNEGWAMLFAHVQIEIYNISFINCIAHSSPAGGGAVSADSSIVSLFNVNFTNNTAIDGEGGAMYVQYSLLQVSGGSFQNNAANLTGGAIQLINSIAKFSNGTVFGSNNANGSVAERDIACEDAALQNDGTVSFVIGQAIACSVTAVSSSGTSAVFPGSLNGLLFPKNFFGSHEIFASLNFQSVVELDALGIPIESTRLTKQNLSWTVEVTNTSTSITCAYDALGPAGQFIRFTHTFYTVNGTADVLGQSDPVAVAEGFIKTSIVAALWQFQSPQNSLCITVVARSHAPIIQLTQHTAADNSTQFDFMTENITVIFSALPYAIYDSPTKRGDVYVNATNFGLGVSFDLVFSSFDLWMNYDPQFGVLMGGPTANPEDSGDGGSAPVALILGLTLGFTTAAALIVLTVIVATLGTRHVMQSRRRKTMMGQVKANLKKNLRYMKLGDEEDEELAESSAPHQTGTFLWDTKQ